MATPGAGGPAEDVPRAFLGCRLPDAVAVALAERVAAVRRDVDAAGLRWVHRERFHTTLRFLGRLDAKDRAPLAALLAPIARAMRPIECRLGAAIALPSWRRAQVVAIALDSNGALEALAQSVDACLRDRFGAPDKPYLAHVTVVRVRRARGGQLWRARRPFQALALDDIVRFTFTELSLFRSDTPDAATPDAAPSNGPRYTALERFAFASV